MMYSTLNSTNFSAARHARLLATGTLALALATLAGCGASGQSSYTKAHTAQAVEKMAMLKSGTEWQMAHQQFLAGDLDKSLKTVDRSIALNGNVPKSHLLRGRIMMEKSRLEEARQSFLRAEELDPNFVEAQYYLGILHERVNQPQEALVRYQKAMELDPSNAQYVVAAGEMLVAQGKLDDAEHLLTDRKQYLQYNAAIRQTIGHIALLRNDPTKAVEQFNEALLLAPGDQAITEDLIQAQMTCNQFADAESMLGKLLDKDSNKNRRDLRTMRAHCLIALDRPVDARTILQELTSDKDGSADLRAWVDLGNVAAILKDKSTLRNTAQRVVAMAPDKPDGYVLRGMYARIDGRPEDALTFADQAIARAKTTAAPSIFKAIVLQDLGRMSEARQALAQGAQIDPTSVQVQQMIAGMDSGKVPVIVSHPDGQ